MHKLSKEQLEKYLNWAENVNEREIRAEAMAGIREHILALENETRETKELDGDFVKDKYDYDPSKRRV